MGLGEGNDVAVGVGTGVGVNDGVGDGVAEGEGKGVGEGVGEGVGNGVAVAVTVTGGGRGVPVGGGDVWQATRKEMTSPRAIPKAR